MRRRASPFLLSAHLRSVSQIIASRDDADDASLRLEDDDPKYLAFVRARLKEPPGGWPEGY
jgi:hypothetical protein